LISLTKNFNVKLIIQHKIKDLTFICATKPVSDLVQGRISQFGLDELVRMAVAAGRIVSHEVPTQFDAAEWPTGCS
jgi:predicted XRE-type DNA-binding protein